MNKIALVLGLSLTTLAGAAFAQAGPAVTVGVGPMLQDKIRSYGERDVDDLRKDLGDEMTHALGHNPAAPVRLDLVIEDAVPNRPTFKQLGQVPSLSLRSLGVGGARISGTATFADGSTRPIRYQWYETDFTNERGAVTWSDADRSFMYLADALRRGKTPDRYTGPGPSKEAGRFGYPWTDRGE
jgi:hypothetical protein